MSTTVTPPASRSAAHARTAATPKDRSLPRCAPVKQRKTVGKVPAVDTAALVEVHDLTIPGGPVGQTWLRIFRPAGTATPVPVVLYVHGDKAVLGNPSTRRLATKLATELNAAVLVVDYSLSPNARYPIAIEETYTAAAWVAEHGKQHGLDGTRVAVAADAAVGDLAAELMLLADKRGGPILTAHVHVSPKATVVLRAALAA